jgi:NADH-quinone oxidoreductase subunit G
MPKCTINGQSVEVKDGSTIIQAYSQAKIPIAHYCWHAGLSVAGVCRLCMVEVEGQPRLQIACNTVVTEGMVINNNSAKVKDAAKWGLDFHLINHPLDCPICDQAGECGLQDLSVKLKRKKLWIWARKWFWILSDVFFALAVFDFVTRFQKPMS